MARYAFNISRYLQSPHKSLELHICDFTKSCITMKVISLWAKWKRWLFFYLSVTFLSPVVSASCVKTSKGIIFLPLQWYSRSLLLYFPDIYDVFFFFKCNFLIKQKDKHWPFDLSSPLFLLTEATSWTLHPFRQVNRQSSLVSQQYCGKIPFRNMRHLYRIHIKKTLKKRLSLYEGKRNLLVFTKWLRSELMGVSRQTQLVYLYMGKSRYIVFLDRSRNTKPISSQLNSIL